MRRNLVTRTIKSMEVTIKAAKVDEESIVNELIIMPFIKDEKNLKKAIVKRYDTDSQKFISIVSVDVTEKLYAMDEAKFIEMADILPSRNINKGAN